LRRCCGSFERYRFVDERNVNDKISCVTCEKNIGCVITTFCKKLIGFFKGTPTPLCSIPVLRCKDPELGIFL
jgi:hypothetical protein